MEIESLLRYMVETQASDMHLKAMRAPLFRLGKKLVPCGEEALGPEEVERMLMSILNERQREQLQERLWVDLGYSVHGVSRFRVSITHQRGSLAAAFRRVPFQFPSIDDWELPEVIKEFAKLNGGLVLVTGPTGSGKSSTLAALVRLMCDTRPIHIVTIEDPIEFLFSDNIGIVSQREVGTDTLCFADGLHNVLRQDPDVIVIGEMRDRDTVAAAITAAETGHLVLSTLHTNSAYQTLDRIVDSFPSEQHGQVRGQLAQVLQGVVSLKLVNRCDTDGLVAAVEILRTTPQVAKLIEEGATAKIEAEIESSVSFFKMQSMDQSLLALVLNGVVAPEVARAVSGRPEELEREIRRWLYAAQKGEGEDMNNSKSDYSKLIELQEIKKLYKESQEGQRAELAEKDRMIQELQQRLQNAEQRAAELHGHASTAQESIARAQQQTEVVRNELEAKVAKLQARIKELSGGQQATQAAGKKGFFSR